MPDNGRLSPSAEPGPADALGVTRPSRDRASGSGGFDANTDRWWWAPLVWLPFYLGTIVLAAVELGTVGAVAAWLGIPAVTFGLIAAIFAREERRTRAARRRHPAGSARDGRAWPLRSSPEVIDPRAVRDAAWEGDDDDR
jgi:hypothetical protein